MKGKYRIYVLDEVPSDLKDRISSIHAEALLKTRGKNESTMDTKDKTLAARSNQGSSVNTIR